MVTDFESWLEKVCSYLDINLTNEIKQKVNALANFKVDKENVKSHKRSVKPGNYQKHMDETTIKRLNEMFAETNAFFGY